MAKKRKRSQIIFRPNLSIGAISAEDDELYLRECFIETGYADTLVDIKNSRSLILGRTGAGKSAILKHIMSTKDNVRQIDPEAFSLRHIVNSNIISYLEEIGVKLDLFYQLLWKHVLCIEIIKLRYNIKIKMDSQNYSRTLDPG